LPLPSCIFHIQVSTLGIQLRKYLILLLLLQFEVALKPTTGGHGWRSTQLSRSPPKTRKKAVSHNSPAFFPACGFQQQEAPLLLAVTVQDSPNPTVRTFVRSIALGVSPKRTRKLDCQPILRMGNAHSYLFHTPSLKRLKHPSDNRAPSC